MSELEKLRFNLKYPLLIIKTKYGFLACGYINPEACNKTEEACAIGTGANSYDNMYQSSVVAVSNKTLEKGVEIGESEEPALRKLS
jgi:uncharacterized protein YunC (DUF1805 family)